MIPEIDFVCVPTDFYGLILPFYLSAICVYIRRLIHHDMIHTKAKMSTSWMRILLVSWIAAEVVCNVSIDMTA